MPEFKTNVVTGPALLSLSENVRGWQKRDCYRQLNAYLHNAECDRVCLLFGLRRTGKTTLLRQAVLDMTPEETAKTAYIKATKQDTIADLNRDMEQLRSLGFRYVLLDEVTLMRDFIDSAALLSDIYAAQGMKIVLSGTDSLGFWFALRQELYDRAKMIHTTFIPYREHSRLLGISQIDEYIRYGGTLRAGELNFDDAEVNAEDASFRDDESTRRYIDTAICKNIQHSLACCEDGGHFRHLRPLYEAGELTGAINRIIEDMNHAFLVSVLTRDFLSHDLGLAARNLRKERDPEKRTTALDEIDTEAVTKRLMNILEIRNRQEQTVPISKVHVAEIKEYLAALDLIMDCPIETTAPDSEPVEHILFTQPGMRYCQAQALVHSLMKDELFASLSEKDRANITSRILEEVRGRMLEDIILLETSKALSSRYKVCKLQFASGEFDMLVYDREENCCAAYEIKHSRQAVPEQARHLRDAEKCALTERRFGKLAGKYVLYLGESQDSADGILYRNAEEFLKGLPSIQLRMDRTPSDRSDLRRT
nr:AAA family ATPase [uncultured Oscillibacter sp.]